METATAFIDGLNLYNGLTSTDYGRKCRWLDPWKLGLQACYELKNRYQENWQLTHVHYFTSMVLNPDKRKRQQHYLSAVEAHRPNEVTVTKGIYQKKPVQCPTCVDKARCHKCTEELFRIQEKGTDVAISVAMMTMCCGRESDNIILVSGDSDLGPAVTAAQTHFERKVAIASPPNRASALQADFKFSFKRGNVESCALPKSVTVSGRSPSGDVWENVLDAHPGWR